MIISSVKERKRLLTDFGYGFIIGFLAAVIIFLIIGGLVYVHHKNKERNIYVEKQIEIRELQEDYSNRSVDELLEIPDVRRAADGATDEFIRKRDDLLLRFRSRIAD